VKAQLSLWRRRLPLVAAAALFAVGNLAVFVTYRSNTESRRAALQARRDDLSRTVAAAEAEAARVSGQRERLGGVSAAMEEFYGRRIGTERATLAPVVADLHAILKETGVAAPQISYSTTPEAKLPLSQMRIAFSVRCDYPRFKRLLHAFESSKSWLAVRDVAISRDSEQVGSVQVGMELVTYFADEEAVAPARPPAESAPRGKGAVPARRAG
jgi:hypothetical protein